MKKHVRVIAGTIGVLLVALLAVALFLRYQLHKSFPVTSGALRVVGLEQPVTIRRDTYGVPHIEAANEHDLMYAVGFVHAQDRLWQMDLARRTGAGRLSEIFGKASLPFDSMFRIVGIRRTSESIASAMSEESMSRLQWYAQGVNAYIRSIQGKFPAEFDLLGYEPEPWTPVHSIMIGRLMAWQLNLSWWTDLTYGALAERVGLDRALDIMPTFPSDVPLVVPAEEWKAYALVGQEYLHTAQSYAAAFGTASSMGGSNAWVVAPHRSSSGAVILANDTHLLLQQPSTWYEMQMQMPGSRVRGMSIAGVPAIVAGRNEWITWGLTNVMADDADFFAERLDSAEGTTVSYGGRWLSMTLLHEEIAVRGDSTVPLTIRLTRHGPVVTDIVMPRKEAHPRYVASMRWTGNEIDDLFLSLTRINRARNWEEFIAGVREFTVPGQNFVYGDIHGNIGYWCGARIPIRGARNSLLPLPGWDPSAEWKGFVPFKELPHRLNPPEGYIASANNKIVDDSYPYAISQLWEPASRIQRLNDVLGKKDEIFTATDFERLQNDTYSYYAREMLPFITDAFRDSIATVADGERVFEYFRNWNYQFSKDDIATTVFQEFMVRFVRNTYRDEMGEEIFHDWVTLTNIPLRVTARLVRTGTSSWFDDILTPAAETRDDIIRRSLREAVAGLRERLGTEMKNWQWGNLHSVSLRHPFGLTRPLDKIFNIGPFPAGGGSTSLVSLEYSFTDPYAVTVGPSFRQVIDLAGDGPLNSVLPSGQSGQIFNDHYADQTRLWLNGGYRVTEFARISGREDRLTLEPVR